MFGVILERQIARIAEPGAMALAIRSLEGSCGEGHEAEEDGVVLEAKAGFDDEAAEQDLAAGILFAAVRHCLVEQALDSEQAQMQMPAPAFAAIGEIAPPDPGRR